ncbi:protein enabled isoform X2 [Sitodiplosis mosellana]|uniref:protein enabled isoform X2 n=1 Tax=Sitodiplosis mosellana TaxID=263140 RepID=UPI00244496D6|nr:protein enabled isoform X2 [Sitodiplosis mosellana]
MCEQSIIGARASVMVYDDNQKKWIPSGTSSGLSKVHIYHHQQNNTFRVVGRKLQDHEVVINCSILKGLKYNQATPTFHQWRDSKFVYGLNFSSQQDAEAFARAMLHALEVLSGRVIQPNVPPPQNGNIGYDEDMGYRTMTREDAAMIQQISTPGTVHTPISQQPPNSQNIPQSPPNAQGHHRTSSAPPQGFGPCGMPPNQAQYHQPQPQPPQAPPQQQSATIYSTQLSQASYGSNQNMAQYNQPIYVSSSSNQSLNQQQLNSAPIPNQNGPIYVSSNVANQPGGMMMGGYQAVNNHAPEQDIYGQTNGNSSNGTINNGYGNGNPATSQYGQSQTAPPVAPAPPPPPFNAACFANGSVPQPPVPPPSAGPALSTGSAPPPPPPPPMGGLNQGGGAMDMSSLAAQLQQAKLKRNAKSNAAQPPAENSGSSTSSGGSNYSTGRASTGMASMMDEMAKTLARRRAQAEKKPDADTNNDQSRPWEKSNTLPHKLSGNSSGAQSSTTNNGTTNNGSESPRPSRKRFGSASEETILKQVNGDGLSIANSHELEALKADILREMRIELNKATKEIIDVIKAEFNRR